MGGHGEDAVSHLDELAGSPQAGVDIDGSSCVLVIDVVVDALVILGNLLDLAAKTADARGSGRASQDQGGLVGFGLEADDLVVGVALDHDVGGHVVVALEVPGVFGGDSVPGAGEDDGDQGETTFGLKSLGLVGNADGTNDVGHEASLWVVVIPYYK